MKGSYINFIKKFIFLFVVLIIIDKGLGSIMKHFFLRLQGCQNANITYAINKAEEDIVIFGSSKANHNYVPGILKDSLRIAAYNAGIDGQSILYHNCVLKTRLARNPPKIIILDLHPDEFEMNRGYDELSILLPYYYSNPEIQPIINLRSRYERYKVTSDLYRYNSMIFKIVYNSLKVNSNYSMNGYIPLNKIWQKKTPDIHSAGEKITFDTLKLNAFKSFLEQAKNAGSKIFVLISPLFEKMTTLSNTIKTARRICLDENIYFADFGQDSFFLAHPEYFSDPSHLNKRGSEIYTEMVCQILKSN